MTDQFSDDIFFQNYYRRQRLRQEMKKLLWLLAAGGIYALWCSLTGIGIPCIVHTIFHVNCPGCGMTRAAVSIAHFKFAEAYAFNHLSVTVIPALLILLGVNEWRYIRTGERRFNVLETILLGIMCYASLFYGVFRNF